MKFQQKKSDRDRVLSAKDEAAWLHEVKQLRKLAMKLWYELQIVEAVCCLEVKDRIDLGAELSKFEMELIKRALLESGGRQVESAKLLGISPSTLNSKIKRFGLPVRDPAAIEEIGLAK